MSGVERSQKVYPVDYRMLDEGSSPMGLILGTRDLMFPNSEFHDVWLLQVLGSHLLEGFFVWEEELGRQISHSKELMESATVAQKESKSQEATAHMMQRLVLATSHFGTSGLSLALGEERGRGVGRGIPFEHSFKAELWMDKAEWTQKNIVQAYEAWTQYLLNFDAWTESEKQTGIPCMLELPQKVVGLPKAMNLGGMQFELRFGKFYVPVPTVKQHPYAMRFFDHLGTTYEQVSDLNFKERVFRHFNHFLRREADRIRNRRHRGVSSYSPSAGRNWLTNSLSVLDLGCGPGLFLEYANHDFNLIGVDVSQSMCEAASSKTLQDGRKYERVIHADGAEMTLLEDESVDLTLMSFVEIWMDRKGFIATMKEAKRVLRSDGALVFNLHNPYPGQIEQMTDWLKNYCGFRQVAHETVIQKPEGDTNGYGDVRLVVVYK